MGKDSILQTSVNSLLCTKRRACSENCLLLYKLLSLDSWFQLPITLFEKLYLPISCTKPPLKRFIRMDSATMCTLEPILEISIIKSVYYLKNFNQIPSQLPLLYNVNKPNFASLSSYTVCACDLVSFSSYDAQLFLMTLSFCKWGLRTCTQYSRCGRTRDLYNCKITCGLLYTKDLIIPKILFAVFTTLIHCFDAFQSCGTISPKSLSSLSVCDFSMPKK